MVEIEQDAAAALREGVAQRARLVRGAVPEQSRSPVSSVEPCMTAHRRPVAMVTPDCRGQLDL
ncbi:hypothetical protein ACFFKE_27795 [Streptomyces mutabilis]|uniref:hypothetical protein n=1 Tax=Streptomyces mutabilis TaxID=67332 RepID=UPI001781813E|nr:hypothetical protein [Streptomyces mutabilis]